MPQRPVTYYLDGKLYEWTFAAAQMQLGILMLMFPHMVKESAFSWLVEYARSDVLAMVFLFTGLCKTLALAANGGSPWLGPKVRSVCALISAILWSQFTVALVKLSFTQGFPSPGLPFWFMFTMAEIYVAYRAVLDVRIPDKGS